MKLGLLLHGEEIRVAAIPAKAGIHFVLMHPNKWIPAFAGMTTLRIDQNFLREAVSVSRNKVITSGYSTVSA